MNGIRWLVYSNIWVAMAAPSLLWTTAQIKDLELPISMYLFVFLSTLGIYNLQRLYDADRFLMPELLPRHAWIQKNKNFLWLLTFSSFGILVVPALRIPLLYLSWLIPALLVSALYFLPYFPFKGKRIRGRDIPFLKITLVAFTWSWTLVSAPCLAFNVTLGKWLPLFGFQFFFCFGLTIPFDIRDYLHDLKAGTLTFVTRFGQQAAKIIAVGCFTSGLLAAVFSDSQSFLIGAFVVTAIAAPLVLLVHSKRSELYYGFLLDGVFVAQGLVFYIVNGIFS